MYAEDLSRKKPEAVNPTTLDNDCMISMFQSDNLSSTIQSANEVDLRNQVNRRDYNSISDEEFNHFHNKTHDNKAVDGDHLTINIQIPPTPQQAGKRSKSGKGRSQPETLVQKEINMIMAVERA